MRISRKKFRAFFLFGEYLYLGLGPKGGILPMVVVFPPYFSILDAHVISFSRLFWTRTHIAYVICVRTNSFFVFPKSSLVSVLLKCKIFKSAHFGMFMVHRTGN